MARMVTIINRICKVENNIFVYLIRECLKIQVGLRDKADPEFLCRFFWFVAIHLLSSNGNAMGKRLVISCPQLEVNQCFGNIALSQDRP